MCYKKEISTLKLKNINVITNLLTFVYKNKSPTSLIYVDLKKTIKTNILWIY